MKTDKERSNIKVPVRSKPGHTGPVGELLLQPVDQMSEVGRKRLPIGRSDLFHSCLLTLAHGRREPEMDPGSIGGRFELDRVEDLDRSIRREDDGSIRDVVVRTPVKDFFDDRVFSVRAMVCRTRSAASPPPLL